MIDAAYVVRVGGDSMHGRLFLPALFAFAVPVAAVPVSRRAALCVPLAIWAVVSGLTYRPTSLGKGRREVRPGYDARPSG